MSVHSLVSYSGYLWIPSVPSVLHQKNAFGDFVPFNLFCSQKNVFSCPERKGNIKIAPALEPLRKGQYQNFVFKITPQ